MLAARRFDVIVLFCLFVTISASAVQRHRPPPATRQSGKHLCEGKNLPKITLEQPSGGWSVSRMLEISGHVSDRTCDPINVNINGDRYLMRTFDGKFQRKFPVTAGKNAVIVSATGPKGTASESRTVYAKVSPVAVMAVLTSDTDGVYTDLHIYEPDPAVKFDEKDPQKPSKHVYWADTKSPSGGEFYLNEQGGNFDQPGYGPYLYTHSSPPLGIYRIDTNYWPSGDKAHTLATLNLAVFGGTASELRRSVKQPLVAPGETVTLAWIKIGKNQTASIYIPGLDPKPKDTKIWPEWILSAPVSRKSGGEGEM